MRPNWLRKCHLMRREIVIDAIAAAQQMSEDLSGRGESATL
jgi:hypothetical protein